MVFFPRLAPLLAAALLCWARTAAGIRVNARTSDDTMCPDATFDEVATRSLRSGVRVQWAPAQCRPDLRILKAPSAVCSAWCNSFDPPYLRLPKGNGTVPSHLVLEGESYDSTAKTYSVDVYGLENGVEIQVALYCGTSVAANGRSTYFPRVSDRVTPAYFPDATSAAFIAIYVYYGIFALFMSAYLIRKRINDRKVPEPDDGVLAEPLLSPDTSSKLDDSSAQDIRLIGYRRSTLGRVVFYWLTFASLIKIPIILALAIDRNASEDGAAFGEDLDTYFFVYFHFTLAWLVIYTFNSSRLEVFFCVKSRLKDAQLVLFTCLTEVDTASKGAELGLLQKITRRVWLEEKDYTLCDVQTAEDDESVHYVQYRLQRYVWVEDAQSYLPGCIPVPATHSQIVMLKSGLSSNQRAERANIVGPNSIPVEDFKWQDVAFKELIQFKHLYQVPIFCFYFYSAYWHVGLVFLAFSVGVIVCRVYGEWLNFRQIQQLKVANRRVRVLIDGSWKEKDTVNLVPGDCFQVETGVVSCDAVVVAGFAVVDESSMTGESMPQQKSPLVDDLDAYNAEGRSNRNTIFSGSTVIHSGEMGVKALAVVTATGMGTFKGKLIQNILAPKKFIFIFEEHQYVAFLLLSVYALICMILKFFISPNVYWAYAWEDAFFVFTKVLSPLQMSVIGFGETIAALRLRKAAISCINPRRIPVAGDVRVMCFDKTGTLTKEGMDFCGVLTCDHDGDKNKFGEFSRACFPDFCERIPRRILHAIATCHELALTEDGVGDDGEEGGYLGSALEVNMFKATKWQLQNPDLSAPEDHDRAFVVFESHTGQVTDSLSTVVRHSFDHNRQTMSVVVKEKYKESTFAFCKGSYEKMKLICAKDTLPSDYDEICHTHAAQGYYVLSMGYKCITNYKSDMAREQVESELFFLGLLFFRNEPRDDAHDAISFCKGSGIRTVMITGDNALTGMHIARRVGMIMEDTPIVLVDLNEAGSYKWSRAQYDKIIPIVQEEALDLIIGGLEVAMTAGAFERMRDSDEQLLPEIGVVDGLAGILLQTRIFARMKPGDKVDCINLFINQGLGTGMCGDGGNDTGALRAAHIGVALSTAEASLVSPFSIPSREVSMIEKIIKEGRCTISSSLACFKFLVICGLFQSVARIILFFKATIDMSRAQYAFLDACTTFPLAVAISITKPHEITGVDRPSSSIMSIRVGLSILQQQICGLFLTLVAVFAVSKSITQIPDALTATLTGEIMAAALTFTVGADQHANICSNFVFVGLYFVLYVINVLITVLSGERGFFSVFSSGVANDCSTEVAVDANVQNTSILAALFTLNIILGVVVERFVMQPLHKRILRRRPQTLTY